MSDDHNLQKDWNSRARLAFLLLAWATSVAGMMVFIWLTQCSPLEKKSKPAPTVVDEKREERPEPLPPEPGKHLDLNYVETTIAQDLGKLDQREREETRYLVTADQFDLAVGDDVLKTYALAAHKAANMISVRSPTAYPLERVADGIWRFSLGDYNLDVKDWEVVAAAEPLKLESFTATGLLLKQLTKTKTPWLHVSNFNDTVLRNAKVYYTLAKVSESFGVFTKDLGVSFAADLKDLDATFAGFAGSLLNQTSHRLAIRLDSTDGYFWQTFDPGAQDKETKNLFKNPGLGAIGTKANFEFLASEVFFSLRNGLMGSALFNAAGFRQDFAPENVVHDYTQNPLSPTIRNAISCSRCHSGGLIGLTDQIRAAVSGPGSQVDPADAQLLLAVYRPQAELAKTIEKDNERFVEASKKLGIDPAGPDPISVVSDRWLQDQTLADVAALLFLQADELVSCLNLSQDGRAEAGALLQGGKITHDQLVGVIGELKRDCRLFQDPL